MLRFGVTLLVALAIQLAVVSITARVAGKSAYMDGCRQAARSVFGEMIGVDIPETAFTKSCEKLRDREK